MIQVINRFFGLFLLLSCVVGLFVPSAGSLTPGIIMISLAFIIFCSYFQINFSTRLLLADFSLSIRYYLLRFVVVPVIVFLALAWISRFYAMIFLLMMLLPAAVSSPSFAVLFGGKPDLSLKILLYSSFLSILFIPLVMGTLPGDAMKVPVRNMLMTLVYTLIVPFFIHLPLRRQKWVRIRVIRYNSLFTLAGLAAIFIVATARNKPAIVNNPDLVVLYAMETLAIYFFLYWLGYMLLPRESTRERVTLAISSGANNIGLGVTLTALYFPGKMNIFFVVAQLAWVVALIPLRKIFIRTGKR